MLQSCEVTPRKMGLKRKIQANFEGDQQSSRQVKAVVAYIAGYMVQRLENKVCAQCHTHIRGTLQVGNEAHRFLANKQYQHVKTGLTVASAFIEDTVGNMEKVFCEVAKTAVYRDRVKAKIVTAISKLPCLRFLLCKNVGADRCNLDKTVVHLFVTMRLH